MIGPFLAASGPRAADEATYAEWCSRRTINGVLYASETDLLLAAQKFGRQQRPAAPPPPADDGDPHTL